MQLTRIGKKNGVKKIIIKMTKLMAWNVQTNWSRFNILRKGVQYKTNLQSVST